ncbi:MAG: mandelate racemase/muconate lactonizing enzyme family protein [Ginsengibacter sp.]
MRIESVDFFYLSMPEVLDIGDGSQDALLVRVRAGGLEGWGECEASPLTSIASYVCPMSHSACKPLKYSVEGMEINDIKDIIKISESVNENSFDLLQSGHTLSGIDIALWDILGKKLNDPVYKLLRYKRSYPKLPYASQLFGETPEETYEKAVKAKSSNFKAVKFGWGAFGKKGVKNDIAHLSAAREGLGMDIKLMVDAGTTWNENVDSARARLPFLKKVQTFWLEEPFINLALDSYKRLAKSLPAVPIAAGEGCSNLVQAKAMMEYAGIEYIQIDTGRIGGITAAKRIADFASRNNIHYVNHTFTSHLALSASLQPFAGIEKDVLCEYPFESKLLAEDISTTKILPDDNGQINLKSEPGLGITINTMALKKYLVDVEIKINGKKIYYTPDL